jgi:hypothetical protein
MVSYRRGEALAGHDFRQDHAGLSGRNGDSLTCARRTHAVPGAWEENGGILPPERKERLEAARPVQIFGASAERG